MVLTPGLRGAAGSGGCCNNIPSKTIVGGFLNIKITDVNFNYTGKESVVTMYLVVHLYEYQYCTL
jgi:hypothetical protein